MINYWTGWILGWVEQLLPGLGGRSARDDDIAEAIERAVGRVEPRLKYLSNYPARYRLAVAHALAYTRQLAAAVPGPLLLDREQYLRNPLLRALVATPDEIPRLLSTDPKLRAYARSGNCVDNCYALLSVQRHQKHSFGIEMMGDLCHREVAQERVHFSDHALLAPAPNEALAREQLAWHLFDRLLAHIVAIVTALRSAKQQLLHEKELIVASLRKCGADARNTVQHELDALLERLYEAIAQLDTRQFAALFDRVLFAPQEYLRLNETALTLDPMGVIRANGQCHAVNTLHFTDLIDAGSPSQTVILIQVPNTRAAGVRGGSLM